jgi:hypothetical protein
LREEANLEKSAEMILSKWNEEALLGTGVSTMLL